MTSPIRPLLPALFALCVHGEPVDSASHELFFDDFNSPASYHAELTPNATNKVYRTNSLPAGHLLKKWHYNWDYSFETGDWKQAFYVVAPDETVMTQAGRSGGYYALSPYRITARCEIPVTLRRYRIELRQFKADNDPLFYTIGANQNGYDGVELGYENQLPGTDETVDDAYFHHGPLKGWILRNRAYAQEWVNVSIEVDVAAQTIDWKMNGKPFVLLHAEHLRPGGFFGIFMHYERGTQFDDVRIIALP